MAKSKKKPADLLPVPVSATADMDEPRSLVVAQVECDVPRCPCHGDHIHIPFKVDQEFKDDSGATYMVRVTQDGCLAPGASPVSFLLHLDQLPSK